jgi:Transposase.
MRREWEPEDLLACWTLMDPDRQLLANKAGATRLGFAVLLKFFELEARFPRHGGEVPPVAVAYLAQQVGVEAAEFTRYGWSGWAVKYHRAQIRQALGFRESTVADEDRLAAWLAAEVCPVELREEALREAVAARCRAERLEPPGASRLNRVIGASLVR